MERIPQLEPETIKSFDELYKIIGHELPQADIEIPVEEEEELFEQAHSRDTFVEHESIENVLHEYGIEIEGLHEYSPDLFEIAVSREDLPADLPVGYGLKGGGARYALEKALGRTPLEPRDIDVIRISKTRFDDRMDRQVAQEHMPDDYAHGHGVEVVDDEEMYFDSRDLTLNEVMTNGTTVRCSKQCLLDTVRRIIRPSDYLKDEYGEIGENSLAKILRFYSDNIRGYREIHQIDPEVEMQIEKAFISPFFLALNLDKAWERGELFAEKYVREINRRGLIPEDIIELNDVLDYLNEHVWDFYFRNAEKSQFDVEDEWVESMQDKLEEIISGRSMRTR